MSKDSIQQILSEVSHLALMSALMAPIDQKEMSALMAPLEHSFVIW